VLAIARRIADPTDALGKRARIELLATSGLSSEGIELALTEHLEQGATPAELEALCSASDEAATRVFVVLAGTVCVAAVRAIALALAASPHVLVKPSRRDPTVAAILTEVLDPELRAHGGSIQTVTGIDEASSGDAVHAYGSNETLAALRSALPGGVFYWPHGAGFGLAVVTESDTIDEAAHSIARDVVPFDQRGCLSPRIVAVEGDAHRARAVVAALDRALADSAGRIPRGKLSDEELRELESYTRLMRASGEVTVGTSHVIGLDPEPSSLWLGPGCRALHVVPVLADTITALLAPLAPAVASLGSNASTPLMNRITAACPGARRSPLGHMQRPAFDGPVDLRTRPGVT
jgi:acyl-CoA reductase-like NAD-dependent aldehyde dehydrogenase